jgi:fructuronate reductase
MALTLLLAYTGSIRGHTPWPTPTKSANPGWQRGVIASYLNQPTTEVAVYQAALLARFTNARMRDRLDRIAADGSQKLPIRILPVLLAERAAGRLPEAATRVFAAWICHLRGMGAPVADARADEVVPLATGRLEDAVPRVLAWLDPALGVDTDVVALVVEQCSEFLNRRREQ